MVEAVKITPQKTRAEIVAETIEHIEKHIRENLVAEFQL